jgi:hypothetical protein
MELEFPRILPTVFTLSFNNVMGCLSCIQEFSFRKMVLIPTQTRNCCFLQQLCAYA